MPKLKRPRVNFSSLKLQMACEWADCHYKARSMPFFMKHVEEHFEDFLPEGITAGNYYRHNLPQDDKLFCQWKDCLYFTFDPPSMIRHVYFHAFHTKIKARGKALLEMTDCFPECQMDSQHRNFVQELPETFFCGWADCEFFTDNIEAFFIHLEEHYEYLGRRTEVVCEWQDCSIIFGNKYRLRDHLTSHSQEKKFGCYNCGNMFSNSTKFLDHLEKQVPLEDQNFQCSHCSKIFANQRLLRDHVRLHVNHYKCPLCDMTCHAPSNLRNHINNRHSEERLYPCDFCGLGCVTKSDLLRHVQTHSQNHNFCCDFKGCDYKSKTTSSLRRHYQKAHMNIDPRKYSCHICPRRFTQGGKLTCHLKQKHKFKWPSGFNRFRYKEHDDGLYRLQTVRYESLELTEHFLNDKKQSEGDMDISQARKEFSEVLQEQVQRVQENIGLSEFAEEDEGGETGFDHMLEDGVIALGAEETVMHPVDDGGYHVRLHDAGMERYQ